MQSRKAAVGKLDPLWLMHHIDMSVLVQLPEADHDFAVLNTI